MVARLLSSLLMTSLPRAESWIPSGTSFNSLNGSLVRAGMSGVPATGFPRSARIVLQQVSMSSLAVPMARLGSVGRSRSAAGAGRGLCAEGADSLKNQSSITTPPGVIMLLYE